MKQFFINRSFWQRLCSSQPVRYVLAFGLLLIIGMGLVMTTPEPVRNAGDSSIAEHLPADNLLRDIDWTYLPGAEAGDGGVAMTGLGRAIVHQDGSAGQANPPVNVAGGHLGVEGNFELQIEMHDLKRSSVLQLYGQLPLIYDEWRYEGKSLALTVKQGTLVIDIWEGTSSRPTISKSFLITSRDSLTLQVQRKDKQLVFLADGQELGSLSDPGIWSRGELWFGADATVGSNWRLTKLAAKTLDEGKVYLIPKSSPAVNQGNPDALKNLRHTHAPALGAAVALNPLMSDIGYQQLALGQFDMITTENELKPQFIHPQPSSYSFTDADTMVNVARDNDLAVHGHTLVFGEANPRWMTDSKPTDRRQIMTEHVQTVVAHFKGRVAEWDVVNEPMAAEGAGLRKHIWYQAMGESYIDDAFIAARAADPDAKLYINEYGLEEDGERWDAFIALLRRLQAHGVPIDGVGFQAHVYEPGDEIDTTVLRRHIQQLKGMGLVSRISEIDVYGDEADLQASQYSEVLAACLAEPWCTSYTTWGITDRYGSTTEIGAYPLDYGNDLLWDKNLKPKPALPAIAAVLKQ